jgi:hypothetical protein
MWATGIDRKSFRRNSEGSMKSPSPWAYAHDLVPSSVHQLCYSRINHCSWKENMQVHFHSYEIVAQEHSILAPGGSRNSA